SQGFFASLRVCDFFGGFSSGTRVISEHMNDMEARPSVRLRTPERRQMAMVVQCPDDLVGPTHPVRMVMAVVEKLDVSRFCEPIKAREGLAGATRPIRVCWWLYGCTPAFGGLARRGSWLGAVRRARPSAGCAAGWGRIIACYRISAAIMARRWISCSRR